MKRPVVLGRSTVLPCLVVEDIQRELEFLKGVFGAEIHQERGEHQGMLWQVEVQLGNSMLMIGRGNRESAPSASTLYVWTDDVDATYARAMALGATLISAPADRAAGLREAGFSDPQGIIWWVGKQQRKPSSREVERQLARQKRSRL